LLAETLVFSAVFLGIRPAAIIRLGVEKER
jgi:hypothetical protein